MAETFGERIRRLRGERSMSQRELAHRVGTDHSYISKIEQGKERPSRPLVHRLAEALETEPVELELAAGYVPGKYRKVILEKDEIRGLLELAAGREMSKDFYAEIRRLVDKHDRVNVPVWLS